MREQPTCWAEASLSEVTSQGQYGWTCKASAQGRIKYLRTTDITQGKINWETVPYCQDVPAELNKYEIHPGEILISRAGSVGYSALIEDVPINAVFASYLIRFAPSTEVDPRYISYFLKTNEYWQQISEASAGIALSNVNAKKLGKILLPVAPSNEQKRIADKLDALLMRVDACREHLGRIPLILKRFRQSILAAACSGLLTADWRNQNPNIDAAKDQLEKALSLVATEYNKASQAAKSDHIIRKPSRPTCLDDYESAWIDDTKIPDTWFVTPLGKVCRKVTDGTHDTPKPSPTGVPYITAKHIRERRIDFENSLFLPQKEHDEIFARCNPQRGDVVIVNIGAGTATPALVRVDFEFSLKNVALLKPIKGLLLGEYLEFYQLHLKPKVFDEVTRGGAQPFMGLDIIKKIPFNLPPLSEQKEIVRRVETLFAYADRLEAHYQAALAQVEKLTPALLAKAFRGELVPQDPNDEPASELLKRIREEQEKTGQKQKQKRVQKKT